MRSIEGPKIDSSNGNRTRIKVLTTIRAHICRLNIPHTQRVLDESFLIHFHSLLITFMESNTTGINLIGFNQSKS
jgi:hypothetical protein